MRIHDLLVEEGREEHIARHGVTIEEVREVVFGRFLPRRTREGRFLLTGQTLGGRFLSIVVIHLGRGVYALIIARNADEQE